MSRASPHGPDLSRRNRKNSRAVHDCERMGCGAGRIWFDLRTMIYEWRWQVLSQTGGFRRVIGRGSRSSGTSMQLIYIARMLHRSLDLLVDAPRILRNLQQSAVIRSCRLVFGVTDPDRKLRLYNSARIVNTAGERRSPTDPWRLFGFIAHFVRALGLFVRDSSGRLLSRLSPFKGTRIDYHAVRRLVVSRRAKLRIHTELCPFRAYGCSGLFAQARPLPSRAGSRLRCPSPP
jgi:hypothetical protein